MSHGYSTDLRKRVLSYYDDHNQTQDQVAKLFKISLKTLVNWIRLRRDTGDYSLKERPSTRQHRKIDAEALKAYIQKHPDHFLWEIGEYFGAKASSVYVACQRLGLTRKKNPSIQRKKRTEKTGVLTGNSESKS